MTLLKSILVEWCVVQELCTKNIPLFHFRSHLQQQVEVYTLTERGLYRWASGEYKQVSSEPVDYKVLVQADYKALVQADYKVLVQADYKVLVRADYKV